MNPITRTKSKNMNRSMIAPQRVKTEARQKQPQPSCLYANVFLLQSIYTGRTIFIEKYLETKFKNDTTVWQFKDRSLQFEQIKIKLHTWDTNGQVNSKNMVLSSIKMWVSKKITNIGIIFYDITHKKSLGQANNFLKQWKDINPLTLPSVIIVASKIDLIQKYGRVISSLEGLQYAKKNNLLYLQSSSKFDVSHIFKTAIHLMMSQLGMSNKEVQEEVDKQIRNMELKIQSNSSIMKQKWKIIYLQPITVNLQGLITIVSTVQWKQNISKAVSIYKLIKQIEQKMKNMSTLEFCIKYYQQHQKNNDGSNGQQLMSKNTSLQNLHFVKYNLEKQIERLSTDTNVLLKDSKLLNKINDEFINSIHRLLQYIKTKYRECNQYFCNIWQANPQIDVPNKKQEQQETVTESQGRNQMKAEIIWVGNVIKKLQIIAGFIMAYYKNMRTLTNQKERIMKCNKREEKGEMDNIISFFIQNKFGIKKNINHMEVKPSIVDIFANENILQANLTETQYKIKEITKQCSNMVNHIKEQYIKTKTTMHENVIVQLEILKHNKKMLHDRYGLKMGQFQKFLIAKMD